MKADRKPSLQSCSKAAIPAKPKRKKAGAQTAQQQIENILESVSDSFAALDAEWRNTYVNEKVV